MPKYSVPAPKPKPLTRTHGGSAIVSDPMMQRITTKKVNTLDNHKPIKSAPKWVNRVDVYDEGEIKRLIATRNLGGLGRAASMKRLCGKFNDIYMMRLQDEPTA